MKDLSSLRLLIIKPRYDAFPLGLAYVLSCLETNNVPFDLVDLDTTLNWRRSVRKALATDKYTAVATGGLIGSYRFFQQVSSLCRRCSPQLPFILGGNITKDSSNKLLFESIGIDYGIVGEAETSLPGLIDCIFDGNRDFGAIPGLIYKNGVNLIIRNPPVRVNLKRVTLRPAWHRFDMTYYLKQAPFPFIGNALKVMPILTGRGCVGKCSFCSPTIGGFRKRLVEDVIDEIEEMCAEYEFDHVLFYNEMFYPAVKDILEFCKQYKARGINLPWITQVRADTGIDVDTFRVMRDAGCVSISAGIESGSDEILRRMNKRTTSKQICTFFRNAKKAGLPYNGTFIIGSEGEREDDIKATVDLVIDLEINTEESLLYVYPGTDIYDRALKKGLVRDELEHLERVSRGSTGLFLPGSREGFLNVTNLSDDQFFEIAIREARRYHTFVFNRYCVKNATCNKEINGLDVAITISGKCNICGGAVLHRYVAMTGLEYKGILGAGVHNRLICPSCLNQLSFKLQACSEQESVQQHFEYLKTKLSTYSRIIFIGMNQDTLFLMRIDLFGMDYSRVLGVVNLSGGYPHKRYVSLPALNISDLPNLRPDCVLSLDCTADLSRLKRTFQKAGTPMPEILCLADSSFQTQMRRHRSQIARHPLKVLPQNLTRYATEYRRKYAPLIHSIQQRAPMLVGELIEDVLHWGGTHQRHANPPVMVKRPKTSINA